MYVFNTTELYLKIVKMVNFVLRVFYHNKNKLQKPIYLKKREENNQAALRKMDHKMTRTVKVNQF